MLTVENGIIRIQGRTSDILSELTVLLQKIREVIGEEIGDEGAMESIALAGKLAFMDEDELDRYAENNDTEGVLRRLGIWK